MKNTIERVIVPYNSSGNSLINKEQYSLFAPIAQRGRPGMAAFDTSDFDIKEQTVILSSDVKNKLNTALPRFKDKSIIPRVYTYDPTIDITGVEGDPTIAYNIGTPLGKDGYKAPGAIPVYENVTDSEGNAILITGDPSRPLHVVNKRSLDATERRIKKYADDAIETSAESLKAYTDSAESDAKAHTENVANRVWTTLNDADIYDFSIVPVQDAVGAPLSGIYNFVITLKDGSKIERKLDLPFEAIQIASVDDNIRDGVRYLDITFVNGNTVSVQFDELFNLDDIVKPDVHVGPTPPEDGTLLWVDTNAGSMGSTNINDKPYDVECDLSSVGLGASAYAKLTISDDWGDGVQHPYRLIIRYYQDDMVYVSDTCVFYSPSTDHATRIEGEMQRHAPTHWLGNALYLPGINTSSYTVFIKRLDGTCSGATLERVESIPGNAVEISNGSTWVPRSYVGYTNSEGVVKPRPITYTGGTKYAIVCRNSAAEVLVPEKTAYSNNAAVPYSYIKNTMLKDYAEAEAVEVLGDRVSRLEDTLISYVSVTGTYIAVPTHAKWATLDRLNIWGEHVTSEFDYDLHVLSGEGTAEVRDNHMVYLSVNPTHSDDTRTLTASLFELPEGTWKITIFRNGNGGIYAGEEVLPSRGVNKYYSSLYMNAIYTTVSGPCAITAKVTGTRYSSGYVYAAVFATRADVPSGRPFVYDEILNCSYTPELAGYTGYSDPDGNWERGWLHPDLDKIPGITESAIDCSGSAYSRELYANYIDFSTLEYVKQSSMRYLTENDLSGMYLYRTSEHVVAYAVPAFEFNAASISGFRNYNSYNNGYTYPWCWQSRPGGYLDLEVFNFPLGTSLEEARDALVGREARCAHTEVRTDISAYFSNAEQVRKDGAFIINVGDYEWLSIDDPGAEDNGIPMEYTVTFIQP